MLSGKPKFRYIFTTKNWKMLSLRAKNQNWSNSFDLKNYKSKFRPYNTKNWPKIDFFFKTSQKLLWSLIDWEECHLSTLILIGIGGSFDRRAADWSADPSAISHHCDRLDSYRLFNCNPKLLFDGIQSNHTIGIDWWGFTFQPWLAVIAGNPLHVAQCQKAPRIEQIF